MLRHPVRSVPALVALVILVLSTSCFEEPEEVGGICWPWVLGQITVSPAPLLMGTDFDVSIETLEGELFSEPEEGWSLTYSLPRADGEVCERTFDNIDTLEAPSVSATQLCQPEGQETLETLLPPASYTVSVTSNGLCTDSTEEFTFPVLESMCDMAPGFSLLDLTIIDLGLEPGASPAQFSIEWQVGYPFESEPEEPSQSTEGFNQTLTLMELGGAGGSFTHEESAEGLMTEDDPLAFSVSPQSFDGFQPSQGVEYALMLEVDSGGSVVQCGDGVEDNDIECIRFILPAQVTGTDCSAFE